MNNVSDSIIKRVVGLAYIYIMIFNTKIEMTYHYLKKHYESIFIEVDKALFNTNRNSIIGEIYKPPSSNQKTFNIDLERLLVKIIKEKICFYNQRF